MKLFIPSYEKELTLKRFFKKKKPSFHLFFRRLNGVLMINLYGMRAYFQLMSDVDQDSISLLESLSKSKFLKPPFHVKRIDYSLSVPDISIKDYASAITNYTEQLGALTEIVKREGSSFKKEVADHSLEAIKERFSDLCALSLDVLDQTHSFLANISRLPLDPSIPEKIQTLYSYPQLPQSVKDRVLSHLKKTNPEFLSLLKTLHISLEEELFEDIAELEDHGTIKDLISFTFTVERISRIEKDIGKRFADFTDNDILTYLLIKDLEQDEELRLQIETPLLSALYQLGYELEDETPSYSFLKEVIPLLLEDDDIPTTSLEHLY